MRKITLASLTAMGASSLWIALLDYARYDFVVPEALIIAGVVLALAGLVATRLRWAPALAGTIAGLITASLLTVPFVVMRLTDPETVWFFLANTLLLASGLVATVAGITATVARYRIADARR
ncbi:MAG: hypothetical protein ACRD0K_03020 [Egibacteraceae bacterium]